MLGFWEGFFDEVEDFVWAYFAAGDVGGLALGLEGEDGVSLEGDFVGGGVGFPGGVDFAGDGLVEGLGYGVGVDDEVAGGGMCFGGDAGEELVLEGDGSGLAGAVEVLEIVEVG